MTKEWYTQNGYNVSANFSQAIIDRAEREVLDAYVLPILPDADPDGNDAVAHALASIAYLRLLQIHLTKTRGGTKEKTGASSLNADVQAPLNEQAIVAHLALRRLKNMPGAVANPSVVDICSISHKSTFFYL